MPVMLFIFLLFFLYGLCIGSFLNVVIYRLPLGLAIAKGRSMCPQCTHILKAKDLIPIFSFLFLQRKCRYCSTPIPWRYPVVETLTGVVFGLCGLVWGPTWYAVLLCLFFSVLIIAWFIDIDYTIIPDRLHVIILGIAFLSWFTGPYISLADRLIGGLGLGLVMLFISWLTRGGIGGGDIKLMAASGLLLGWQCLVPAFFLAYVLAAIWYIIPFLQKKLPPDYEAPMAPFFALALMVFSLFGQQLLRLWLH